MRIDISEEIRRDPRLARAIARTTSILESVIAPSATRLATDVAAEWDLARDERNRPQVALQISDDTGSATARFSPDELTRDGRADLDRIEHRMIRLWGDLLQVRSNVLMTPIYQSIRENGGPQGALR